MAKFYYKCLRCKTMVKETSKYCDNCGVKLPEEKYSLVKQINYTIRPDNSVWEFFDKYKDFIPSKAAFINNAVMYYIPYWKKQFVEKSKYINEEI